MVVIDEHDVGKTREQVLMDLIYEALGERIPLDKVKFGKPRELDQRTDLWKDPNTFISARVDPRYDMRYSTVGSGFMYRRRSIVNHCRVYDFSGVAPTSLPFKIHDILASINEVMPYPLQKEDLINHEYTTLEQVEAGLKLSAHPESLLWIKAHTFNVDTSFLKGKDLLEVTMLDGFNYYGEGETYPA